MGHKLLQGLFSAEPVSAQQNARLLLQKVLDLWPPAPSSVAVGGRMEELLCLSSFPKVPTPVGLWAGGQWEQAGAGDSTVSHRQGTELPLIYKPGICVGVCQSFLILNVSSRAWWVPNEK